MRRTKGKTKKRLWRIPTTELVPTGSTLLNLACSDNPFGAFALGSLVNIIGDRSSGKTMLGLSVLAEMAWLKRLRKYNLDHDDAEAANRFNMEHLFGKQAADRINVYDPPSQKTQDMMARVIDLLDRDEPFCYLLDSFDALTSAEEEVYIRTMTDLVRQGKKGKGTYGLEKPKLASQLFRVICSKLEESESIMLVISQTRDTISSFSFVEKNRSGGRALEFYSIHEMWLKPIKTIKRRDRKIGFICRVKVSKNKVTGKERTVDFPIYFDYGIDDIGSCIDWMVKEKYWPKRGNTITATGLRIKGTRKKLIQLIEENDLERQMQVFVGKAWKDLEAKISTTNERKKKYV